ncbi:hypothetical protein F5B22DRAFT_255381 [Xylaria bambusicola]|uniref:uncharacterized protein n=1 Tax=Xylaria bambusicola TaxID=326684 RepID=UPI002008476E|nr:uncharacterized protein F5B22DRAFT_255381 [Xylaria bambusicola]KAI0525822.1 hypothetical protein F5B22DRAFT_255381 [Xylaria bambusicola]
MPWSQQVLLDPTATIKQEVESASPYPSVTISAQKPKRVRTTRACDSCRYSRSRCDGNTPCDSCEKKHIECKRKDYLLNKLKSDQVAAILAFQQKIYDAVSDLGTKFDRQQSAGSHDSSVPAHPSTKHSFFSSNRSTKASDSHSDSEDRSTSSLTPATDIPTTSPGEADQEPLNTIVDNIDDEAEWDSNIIWFYIGKYYDTTSYTNGIIPREQLDLMVNQFLIDRDCWDERSGTDINVAIVFLVLSIGKLYAKRSSLSVRPGQDTSTHGFTYFKLGKDMLNSCSPSHGIANARANALLGLYLYQLGRFPAALGYLSSASQFVRDSLLWEIEQLYETWLKNKLLAEDRNILMLHMVCLTLECEISQTMLGGF